MPLGNLIMEHTEENPLETPVDEAPLVGSTERIKSEEFQTTSAKLIALDYRDFKRNLQEGEAFSNTYKLAREIDLTEQSQKFKINLDPEVNDILALLFVGGRGKSHIKNIFVNQIERKGVKRKLFENDWQKIEVSKLKDFSFSAKAEEGESSIKIYIQFKRGEE